MTTQLFLRPDNNRKFVAYVPTIKSCHAWVENPEEEYIEERKSLPDDVETTVS